IVIASTWRSGSSFVYDLFDSHPDVYVHYEPLQPYGVQTFYQESSFTEFAQNLIHSLSQCRYNSEYLSKASILSYTFRRNQKLMKYCEKRGLKNQTACYWSEHLETICKAYKWTGIKLT
ncbi:hypothetical protein Avbf_09782, partial [Armadillidium vulgare]